MALIGQFGEEGGKGRGRVRRDSHGGAGSAGSEAGKKKGRGEGEADRRDPGVSVCEEKEKEAVRWAGSGVVWWADRPGWAERWEDKFFFFFSNSF
jgi:hypothetical protein